MPKQYLCDLDCRLSVDSVPVVALVWTQVSTGDKKNIFALGLLATSANHQDHQDVSVVGDIDFCNDVPGCLQHPVTDENVQTNNHQSPITNLFS